MRFIIIIQRFSGEREIIFEAITTNDIGKSEIIIFVIMIREVIEERDAIIYFIDDEFFFAGIF